MRNIFKIVINQRVIILAVLGTATYLSVSYYHISLWWIFGIGAVTGIIFGKVFCRWVCPMGLLMELMMSLIPDGKVGAMYQYHKLGCPIAWISGWLNKYSLFKINLNSSTCKSCGACDKQCYIVAIEPAKYSLYKSSKEKPGNSYTCSKCLKCVAACPNGSLKYKI